MNDGLLTFDWCPLWKHHVSLRPMALPSVAATGPTTLLLTVRNITSWLASMSRSPYELFPHPKRHPEQYSLRWLLNDVVLQTQDAGYDHSPGPLHYPSAVELWFAYIRGYLSGHLAPGSEPGRVIVVQQENILRRPREVANALAEQGLPRNDADFEVVEQLEIGYTRTSRSDILRREERIPKWSSFTAVPIQSEVLSRLRFLGCVPYTKAPGYPMSRRHWSAESTYGMRLGFKSESPEREVDGEGASEAADASDAIAQFQDCTERMRQPRLFTQQHSAKRLV